MHAPNCARWLAVALFAASFCASAGPSAGEPDAGFGDEDPARPGTVVRGFDNGFRDDAADRVLLDAEGRIVAAGYGSALDGKPCVGLMRFLPNGAPDTLDFGPGQNDEPTGRICHHELPLDGAVLGEGGSLDAVVQPDAKVIVSGTAMLPGSNGLVGFVCRFLSGGKIDTNFAPASETPGCRVLLDLGTMPTAPRLGLDGDRLLVVSPGLHDQSWQLRMQHIALADGSVAPIGASPFVPVFPDIPAFDGLPRITDLVQTPSGNFLVSWHAASPDTAFHLGMFNPDTGLGVEGFNGTGVLAHQVDEDSPAIATALEALPDGRIVVAGGVLQGPTANLALVRFLEDGQPDLSFNEGSPLLYSPCPTPGACVAMTMSMARASDGKMLLGGTLDHETLGGKVFAARLHSDGSLDAGFGTGGLSLVDGLASARDMVLQGDRVVFGGSANSIDLVFTDDDNDGIDEIVQKQHEDFAVLRLSDGNVFSDEFEGSEP